jgi:hypothetical protein
MSGTNVLTTRDSISDKQQPLSASEIDSLKQSFAENGYFVVRQVVSPERLTDLHAELVEAFDRMQQSGELFSGGGLVSGHLNCFPGKGARFVYDTLQERGFIDLIKQLHPQVLRMPNIGCNFNLPGSAAQHYHTDRPFTRDFMIANIAVVDTVVENGAIELIPGTHKRFYKYTRFVLERPQRNSIRVPMKKGDLLVRTSNVWHRGMPNQTKVPRPMLALTWEDGGSMHDDPFTHEEGRIQFYPNWFQPTRMGRMREQLFVKVPLTYSACRFARSLYDPNY